MVRPRWHDALIIGAIVAVFSVGVWALWWGDVRAKLGWDDDQDGPNKGENAPALVSPGRT